MCKKEIALLQNEENKEEVKRVTEDLEKHFKCYDLKEMKENFDKALYAGSAMVCPNCKMGGQKDDACTHMFCDNCRTEWCYLCGLSR